MENWEGKFISLELDEEIRKLKEKLGNPNSQNGQKYSTSPGNNDRRNRFLAILGLKHEASQKEIKQAYRSVVKKCHPDLFYDNPQQQQKAQEILTKINQAYEEFCCDNDS